MPTWACSKSHCVECPLALVARPRMPVGLLWSSVCLPVQINATTLKCEPCLSTHPPTRPRPRNHHTTHLKTHPPTNQDMQLGTTRHTHQSITSPSQRATQPDPSTLSLISWMEREISSTVQICRLANKSICLGRWAPRHVGMNMHRQLCIRSCLVTRKHGEGLMIPCTSHLP